MKRRLAIEVAAILLILAITSCIALSMSAPRLEKPATAVCVFYDVSLCGEK